jgi:hypothetical protein
VTNCSTRRRTTLSKAGWNKSRAWAKASPPVSPSDIDDALKNPVDRGLQSAELVVSDVGDVELGHAGVLRPKRDVGVLRTEILDLVLHAQDQQAVRLLVRRAEGAREGIPVQWVIEVHHVEPETFGAHAPLVVLLVALAVALDRWRITGVRTAGVVSISRTLCEKFA